MLQRDEGYHSKYVRWLTGIFVPIRSEVNTLTQVGYSFPEGVLFKRSKSTSKPPAHLVYSAQSYPEFSPGFTTQGVFVPINPLTDTSAVKFQKVRRVLEASSTTDHSLDRTMYPKSMQRPPQQQQQNGLVPDIPLARHTQTNIYFQL